MDSPREVLRDVLNGLANIFALLSEWLLYVSIWVTNWPWIDRLSVTFENMASWFASVSWWFVQLRDPLLSMYDATMEILSWSTIQSRIRLWLTDIELIMAWFLDRWNQVAAIVDSWWDIVKWDVKNWINIAVQGLDNLKAAWSNFWYTTWPDFLTQFDTLAAAWSNFWTFRLPELVDFSWIITWWNARLQDIGDMINTAFTVRDSLWAGWQELRTQVTEFFADPVEFIWAKFTDWFFGPEV